MSPKKRVSRCGLLGRESTHVYREDIDHLQVDQLVSNGDVQKSLDTRVLFRHRSLATIHRAKLRNRVDRNIRRVILNPKLQISLVVVLATFVDAESVVWVDLPVGVLGRHIVKSADAVAVDNIAGAVLRNRLHVDANVWKAGSWWRRCDGGAFDVALGERGCGAALVDAVFDARGDVVDVRCDVLRQRISGRRQSWVGPEQSPHPILASQKSIKSLTHHTQPSASHSRPCHPLHAYNTLP